MPASEEIAKALAPIIGDTVGNISNLVGDELRLLRWKRSQSILQRAERFRKKRGIPPKNVPLKFLLPFLESSSIEEENDGIENMWANLLVSGLEHYDAQKLISLGILKQISTAAANEITILAAKMSQWDEGNIYPTVDPSNENEESLSEFKDNLLNHLMQEDFIFSQLEHQFSVEPDPMDLCKNIAKNFPFMRYDIFCDHLKVFYQHQDEGEEFQFYSGTSESLDHEFLSRDTISELVSTGIFERSHSSIYMPKKKCRIREFELPHR